MQYALLIYGRPAAPAAHISDAVADVLGAPQVTAWARLQPDDTASTVRGGRGSWLVTDGPFIESKEYLAGIIVIDVADFDEALALARRAQDARQGGGAIEIRPLVGGFGSA